MDKGVAIYIWTHVIYRKYVIKCIYLPVKETERVESGWWGWCQRLPLK